MKRLGVEYKFQKHRSVVIDDELAGRPFRLSVTGDSLKTKPWAVWATSLVKSASSGDFAVEAAKALTKLTRRAGIARFWISNKTSVEITIEGFPTLTAGKYMFVVLVDGKWMDDDKVPK